MKEQHFALSPWEHERLKRLLAREPQALEAEVVAALWSEQCSYKSTKAYLSELPAQPGPGDLIELDDTYALLVNLSSAPGSKPACIEREHSACGGETLGIYSCLRTEYNYFLGLALLKKHEIPPRSAVGVKNRVLYVGSDLSAYEREVSSNLSQATRQCIEEKLIAGISSIGTAGLALACFSMASKASTGAVLNLEDIRNLDLRREANDILLSEKHQRMLIIASPAHVARISNIFAAAGLACDDLGRVTGDGLVRISYQGHEVINLAATLVWENAPRYRYSYQSIIPKAYGPSLASQVNLSLSDICEHKNYTSSAPNHISLLPKLDANIAYSWLSYDYLISSNAFEAAKRAVWLGAMSVSIDGARARAAAFAYATGPLEEEAPMTRFKHTIDGIAFACEALAITTLATHVHIINQASKPNLIMGIIGVGDHKPAATNNFFSPDSILVILGELPTDYTGAEFVFNKHQENPPLRAWEYENIAALCEIASSWALSGQGHYTAVVGSGGLMSAIYEIQALSGLRLRLEFGAEWLPADLPVGLLSEDSPRIVACLDEKDLPALMGICAQKVPIYVVGRLTTSKKFLIYHDQKLVFEGR